ncbi:MAG: NUDIX hydrolase [Christensenellales bacterium]|jgi:8-oxo-dGTP pyrophosphatase MutT (NUDIX family)
MELQMRRAREIVAAYAPGCEQEARDRAQMLWLLDRFPDCLTRENPVAHMTASAWIVDPARERALLAYHNQYDSWAWTGGHADGEGDLLPVALREAREETGLCAAPAQASPISLESLCVEGHIKRGAYVSAHIHMNLTYLLIADPAAPVRPKADENSGVRWFAFREVNAHCSEPFMRTIYDKLMSRARA